MITRETTITRLQQQGRAAEDFLIRERGFTTASFDQVIIHDNFIAFDFRLEDDFQKELETKDKFHNSGSYFIYIYFDDESCKTLEQQVAEIPSREMRELEVLARQLGRINGISQEFLSHAGREFAKDLNKRAESMTKAIKNMKREF